MNEKCQCSTLIRIDVHEHRVHEHQNPLWIKEGTKYY